MTAPWDLDGYGTLGPFARARAIDAYIKRLTAETETAKAALQAALKEAYEAKDSDDDGFVTVRYADGRKTEPDISELMARYPAQYDLLVAQRTKQLTADPAKLKLAKKDLAWLFPDKDERTEAEAAISIETACEPFYSIMSKAQADAYKRAHPEGS